MKKLIFIFIVSCFCFAAYSQIPSIGQHLPTFVDASSGGNGFLNGLDDCWEPTNSTTLYGLHNGNDGTITGATYSSGELAFDGSDYVTVSPTNFISATSGTFAVWFNPTSNGDYGTLIGFGYNTTTKSYMYLQVIPNNGGIRFLVRNNGTTSIRADCSYSFTQGNWYHVALTSDGSTYKLYIDGSEVTFSIGAGSNNGDWLGDIAALNTFDFGRYFYLSAFQDYFQGSIKQIGIWNIDLSASDINTLASDVPFANFTTQIKVLIQSLWNSFYINIDEIQTQKIAS